MRFTYSQSCRTHAAVGGRDVALGVWDYLLARDVGRVLWQGINVSRRILLESVQRHNVLRGHGKHRLGLLDHSLSHLPSAVGRRRVEHRLLKPHDRVRRYGFTLECRRAPALHPEGVILVLGQGVEYGLGRAHTGSPESWPYSRTTYRGCHNR